MLYKRGGVWWVEFHHGGRRYRLSTGQADRRRAESKARALRVEVERTAGPPGRQRGVALCILEGLDLDRVDAEGFGPVRRRTVEGLWRPLLRLMRPDRDACSLTVGDVVDYCGKRRKEKHRGQPVRGQTIRREVQALVRALRLAKRDRVIGALPFDPDELPRIHSDAPKAAQKGKLWRPEQIEAVLGHLSAKAVTAGHRNRLRLIMLTGLRLEELHRVHPSWVVPTLPGSPAKALLQVPADAVKCGDARTIPLCQEALDIVKACTPFRRKKPNKSLALASKLAGLPGVLTPRDLRAFYLSHAARLSGDAVAVQRLGGHTNIATTGLYLHSDRERAIAAGSAVSEWAARIGQDSPQSPPHSASVADGSSQKPQ